MAIVKKVLVVLRCNFCNVELTKNDMDEPLLFDSEESAKIQLKEANWRCDNSGQLHVCDVCITKLPDRILQFF